MRPSIIVIIVILLAVAVTVPAYFFFSDDSVSLPRVTVPLTAMPSIEAAGNEAFGTLSGLQAVARDSATGTAEAADVSSDRISILPLPPEASLGYKYVYAGGTIPVPAKTLSVFERVSGITTSSADILRTTDFGVLNLSSFPGSSVQMMTFLQEASDGYMVTVDLQSGTASINQSAAASVKECLGGDCGARTLSAADLPSDEDAVAAAEAFLSAHGISTAAYGEAVVTSEWGVSAAAEIMPVSSSMQIVYPLVIDGREVYSQWGEPTGMMVSVDAATLTVTSVSNITSQEYRSSSYATVQDTMTIKEIVERGGVYGGNVPAAENVAEIQYGTPTLESVVMSRVNDKGAYTELLVPAYVFPVLEDPQGWHRPVVVPLIEELLPSTDPITTDGSGSSASGSAGAAIDLPEATTPVRE